MFPITRKGAAAISHAQEKKKKKKAAAAQLQVGPLARVAAIRALISDTITSNVTCTFFSKTTEIVKGFQDGFYKRFFPTCPISHSNSFRLISA